jgi:hypothetical protein
VSLHDALEVRASVSHNSCDPRRHPSASACRSSSIWDLHAAAGSVLHHAHPAGIGA